MEAIHASPPLVSAPEAGPPRRTMSQPPRSARLGVGPSTGTGGPSTRAGRGPASGRACFAASSTPFSAGKSLPVDADAARPPIWHSPLTTCAALSAPARGASMFALGRSSGAGWRAGPGGGEPAFRARDEDSDDDEERDDLDDEEEDGRSAGARSGAAGAPGGAEVDGMSRARRRRLERAAQRREERKQEQDRVFQEFSRDVASRHPELMDLLEDDATPESAEQLAQKVEQRLKAKFGDWIEERTGSDETMQVHIREVDPFDLTLWLQLQERPSEEQLDSLSSVFRAWYLIGKLGGYNASNLQFSEDTQGSLLTLKLEGAAGAGSSAAAVYKTTSAESALPAAMHNISDLEVQGALVRVWMDLGTADVLALDVLINALLCFSTDHVGIKSVTFGGDSVPGWSEAARAQHLQRKEQGIHQIVEI